MAWHRVFSSEHRKPDDPARRVRPGAKLSWDDIGRFSYALTAARGKFTEATKGLAQEFGLGPRGPWILGIIGRGPVSPHELADAYGVGRSLITAELTRLAEAGLIIQGRDPADGRRATLALTEAGEAVRHRLGEALENLLETRLKSYSRDEIMRCAALLGDFAREGAND